MLTQVCVSKDWGNDVHCLKVALDELEQLREEVTHAHDVIGIFGVDKPISLVEAARLLKKRVAAKTAALQQVLELYHYSFSGAYRERLAREIKA